MTTYLIDCPHCDDGWVRVPDGYGCVAWDHCSTCHGKAQIETTNQGEQDDE